MNARRIARRIAKAHMPKASLSMMHVRRIRTDSLRLPLLTFEEESLRFVSRASKPGFSAGVAA